MRCDAAGRPARTQKEAAGKLARACAPCLPLFNREKKDPYAYAWRARVARPKAKGTTLAEKQEKVASQQRALRGTTS